MQGRHRESKTVLDSKFHTSGFRIPATGFRIPIVPESKAQDFGFHGKKFSVF